MGKIAIFTGLIISTMIVLVSCEKDVVGPPDPPQKPVINRILFISNRETPRSSQIYSMKPDGSDVRRITYPADSISFSYAVWSPDLKLIAVVWDYYDIRRTEFPMLSIIDTSGNLLYHLSSMCYYLSAPVWSWDGREVAFSVPKSYFNVVPQIFIATVGEGLRQITKYGESTVPTVDTSAMPVCWTEKGLFAIMHFDSMYYDSPGRRGSVRWGALAEIDFSGKLVKTVFEDSIKTPRSADISTSGEIVFRYWRYGAIMGLFLLAKDGQSIRQLGSELFYQIDTKFYGTGIEWSPDGNSIAFSITQQKPLRGEWIYIVDRFGNITKQLTPGSEVGNCVADWR
jgi:Tol biopolymer transport system component